MNRIYSKYSIFRFFSGYINRTLCFVVFIAVMPAIFITVYSGFEFNNYMMKKTEEDALQIVNNIAHLRQLDVEKAQVLLATLAKKDALHNLEMEKEPDLLSAINMANPEYSGVLVVGTNGIVLAASDKSFVDRDMATILFQGSESNLKEFAVAGINFTEPSLIPTIYCRYPLINRENVLVGFLAVGIPLKSITLNGLSRVGLTEGAELTVFGGDLVIAQDLKSFGATKGSVLDEDVWSWLFNAKQSTGTHYIYNSANKKNYIISYSQLRTNNVQTPYLTILLSTPQYQAYLSASSMLGRNILLLFVSGLLAFFIARIFGKLALGNNINKLLDATVKVSNGDFKTRVQFEVVDSDIGKLAKGFNEMIETIDAKTRALTHAKQAADTASKAKGEFLANISHELRTPMNAIIGLSYLALKSGLNEKQKNYINKINVSGSNLLVIINDILDFSKIESGKLELEDENFKLHELINNVIDISSVKAKEKDLSLTLFMDPNIPKELRGAPLRIWQIINNLLNNSLRFTETGYIKLSCALEEMHNDRVRIRFIVEDSGIGMSNEQVTNLFTPFTQVDSSATRKFGGTGIGLSIVKRLVTMMSGEIKITSQEKQGTVVDFYICLDVATNVNNYGSTPLLDTAVQVARNVSSFDPKLSIDNDTDTSFLGPKALYLYNKELPATKIAELLEHLRWNFQTVSGLGLAMDLMVAAEKKQDPFEVLFVDNELESYSGLEAINSLLPDIAHEANKTIAILVARDGYQAVQGGVGANKVFSVISPPFVPDEIEELVNAARSVDMQDSSVSLDNNISQSSSFKDVEILLVEDNLINQQVASELLEDAGFIVTIANNGREGLDILNANDVKRFSVVLMDLQMPVMDGYEASTKIRADKRYVNLPIIALTAHASEAERQRCLGIGMNDHISKPIEIDKFFNSLSRWVSISTDSNSGAASSKNQLSTSSNISNSGNISASSSENTLNKTETQIATPIASQAEPNKIDLELEDKKTLVQNELLNKVASNTMTNNAVVNTSANALTSAPTSSLSSTNVQSSPQVVKLSDAPSDSPSGTTSDSPRDTTNVTTNVTTGNCLEDLAVSGIAVDQALQRLGGNKKLYTKLLHGFVTNQASTAQDMHAAFADKNFADVERLAHTIKGLSATIGDNKLSKLCAYLENSFKNVKPEADLVSLYAELDAVAIAIERSLARIKKIMIPVTEDKKPKNSEPATKAIAQEHTKLSPELLAKLQVIKELLDDSDSAVIEAFEELEPELKQLGWEAHAESINAAVAQFDFEEASLSLDEILKY